MLGSLFNGVTVPGGSHSRGCQGNPLRIKQYGAPPTSQVPLPTLSISFMSAAFYDNASGVIRF